MATDVKCVLIFRDNSGTGWSEIHYRQHSNETPPLDEMLAHLVDVIVPRRADLLSSDCFCIGARVSYPRPGAVASLNKRFYQGGPSDVTGVSPALSLAVEFVDASKTRRKRTHLRGFWDGIEANGEYHPEGDLGETWKTFLNDWKTALVAGQYGWLTKIPADSKSGIVNAMAELPSGHVTFTTTDPLPAAVRGTIISVRISRINNSKSPANESHKVIVSQDGLLMTTVEQLAVGPLTSSGRYNFRSTGFVVYNGVYNVVLGRRQQGRPFGQLPGRQSARARY